MKKNQNKTNSKNLVYVVVMVSIVVTLVLSFFSMKRNIMTSQSVEDTQKIFSSNSETIEEKEEIDDVNKKFIEKISFVKEEEKDLSKDNDKKEEQQNLSKDNDKKEIQQNVQKEIEQDKKEIQQSNEKEDQQKNIKEKQDNKIPNTYENSSKENQNYDDKEVFFQNKDSFIVPLSGNIERDFSHDKLIYSKTLDEWRVHKGIDISAKEGACVKAVLDGYVEEIKNDEEYGMSVSIRHSKNLVSLYKSLSNDVLVLPNQIIKQGDIIGFVGNTSKIEDSIGSHLHFEMINKNKLVDPKIYIQFNKK